MGMDHYRIIRQLGGTSGTFLAVDKQDETKCVVIKRLKDGMQGMQELNVSLRVRHPNIIPFLESFVHDGGLYVVLRYADGGDLGAYLERRARERKPVEHCEILRWFRQLIDALRCCHDHGIMHRDVKPDNVFLSADAKELYLGDFGSSKAMSHAVSLTTTFIGSPIWISPELLQGAPYGYNADVWSLGCVFYEMVALKRPFSSNSFAALVQQVTSGDIAPLPNHVPADVKNIIMGMMRVIPSERLSLRKAMELTDQAIELHTPPVASCLRNGVSEVTPLGQGCKKASVAEADGARQQALVENKGTQRRRNQWKKTLTGCANGSCEEKLSEWVHARNNDFNVIECYLERFRKSDEILIAAMTPLSADNQAGQRRNAPEASAKTISDPLVGIGRAGSKPRTSISTHVTNGCRPSIPKKTGRLSKLPKAGSTEGKASPVDGESLTPQHLGTHALRWVKGAVVACKPSPPVPQFVQKGEERQSQRAKRELERAKMLQMIREQKAKAQQQRRAKGLNETKGRVGVEVEIVLPDNVRYFANGM
ncbi:Protein kinase domain [Trypanosoma vivax]|uniref:non-specific serine/threonine protein kinase n=1 Tax=Trypanosoma vivax (strain Y486) TaxID=1055687 RepID=G0U0A1_TRYVY|nr:putative serine/threonine-protein kinase [Trypanosoma vivax]KAH8614272.1 Protein kinase domain [Trypanosoma vivax]CCC49499.1 putative serine/threonine-protein kinase [Trypanosoma vivax Y486]